MVRQDFWGNGYCQGYDQPGSSMRLQTVGIVIRPPEPNRDRTLSQMSVWCRTACSETDTAKSPMQGSVDIAVSNKLQKNRKDTFTLLTTFL